MIFTEHLIDTQLSTYQSKWLKHYLALCNRAQFRANTRKKALAIFDYVEMHHILPKCMGGSNNKDNLAFLSAREHFIAHLLLVKIFPKEIGLVRAVYFMKSNDNNNSKTYSWLKKLRSVAFSGENNPMYGISQLVSNETRQKLSDIGKGKIRSNETKEAIRQANLNRTPELQEKMTSARKNNGKPWHSEEAKENMKKPKSEEHKNKLRGIKRTEKQKQETSQRMIGRKWHNNGISNFLIFPENNDKGYHLGRLSN